MYGLLATACGYTYPQIDAMIMSDVYELMDYWNDHPPTHILVALRIGYKAKPRVNATASAPSSPQVGLSELFREMTGQPLR